MSKKENREFWDECMDKLDDKYVEESASLKSKPVFNPKILVGATAVAACLALNVGVIALINRSNNELPTSSGETPISDVTTTPITEDAITTTTPPVDDTSISTVTSEDVTEKVDISKVGFDTHYKFSYNSEGNNYYDLALTLVDSETDENITSMVVENPFVTDGDCVMPGDAYMPNICESIQNWQINCFLLTNNVDVYRILPVVIPGIKDGEVCNAVSLYMLTDKEIIRLNGEDIYTSNARLFMNEYDPGNIISFMNLSGGITNCFIDFEANTYTLRGVVNDMGDDYVVATNEILSKFEFDLTMQDYIDFCTYFGTNWADDTGVLEFDLLKRADVEFTFSFTNGRLFMIKHPEGEETLIDIYYIDKNNENLLYSYENIPENFDEINLYDYSNVYQRVFNKSDRSTAKFADDTSNIIGFNRCLVKNGLDPKKLYNIEVTDVNGNVWYTDELSSEEGLLPIRCAVLAENGHDSYILKMKNEAGEEKYISFDTMLNFPEGEHYVIDMPISISREYEKTEKYIATKVWIERMPVSMLIEEIMYRVCSDGSYYAHIAFGADQSQWLGSSEGFYYENGEYKLLCDDLGLSDSLINNDYLYLTYSDTDADNSTNISLRVYKKGEMIFDGKVLDDGHVNYSGLSKIGNYVVADKFDGAAIIKEENGRIFVAVFKDDVVKVNYSGNTFKLTYNGVEYTQDDVIPDELFVEYK
mgnify:CR=1 FL=1